MSGKVGSLVPAVAYNTYVTGVSIVENLLLSKTGSLNPCAHESYPVEQAFVHVLHIAKSHCDV